MKMEMLFSPEAQNSNAMLANQTSKQERTDLYRARALVISSCAPAAQSAGTVQK